MKRMESRVHCFCSELISGGPEPGSFSKGSIFIFPFRKALYSGLVLFSTPLDIGVLETHWGIALVIFPRNELMGYYTSMALLL